MNNHRYFPWFRWRLLCLYLLFVVSSISATRHSLAQDPTDNLTYEFPSLRYLTGTLVYTPANGNAPLRLRMVMTIGNDGSVGARTERMAAGQAPFRYWAGYARPQPEFGPVADSFYNSSNQLAVSRKPDGSFKTVPLPDGLVAAGPLQPLKDIGDPTPNLALGSLNFRLANHRVTGGGTDPDGSLYAFSLREQKSSPPPDPGTFIAGQVNLADQLSIEGSLVVTHPDGQVDRLPATGYIYLGTGAMFIDVPTLNGGRTVGTDFKGPIKYSELRETGGRPASNGEDVSGVLHIAPSNRFLLPGVQNIGVARHYGRLTGGCVADDGTAYSFVLSTKPFQVSTIGVGF